MSGKDKSKEENKPSEGVTDKLPPAVGENPGTQLDPSKEGEEKGKSRRTATEEAKEEAAPVLTAPSAVRAKFVCGFIKTHQAGTKDVHMHAVATGSEENKEFSQYTPVGQFMIQIAPGKAAGLFFEVGKEYYFDITIAPAPEATEAE